MRRVASGLLALAMAAVLAACTPPGAPTGASPATASGTPTKTARGAPKGTPGARKQYLVFYATGKQRQAAAAVARAGGATTATEPKLGYLMATADGDTFVNAVGADPAVVGVSPDRAIGYAGDPAGRSPEVVPHTPAAGALPSSKPPAKGEPLASRQWDMKAIGADRAHQKAPGSKKVLVGIIDTGVDGTHPDIAPNFDRALSRNFVTDKPKDDKGDNLDGPCEVPSCKDPVDEDDDGHGTHVASTIGSPLNGIGVAGVAPGVSLVNIRAGQDSGFFFLKPSLDALTYAGDIGVDVVNMSYYVDPWLYNCPGNKADSQAQRLEQRAVVVGMQRALDYARGKGVTLISALGNGSTDLGKPKVDKESPGYPRGDEKIRKVDDSCVNVPAESKGVISVAATGPSGRKAVYSDYGTEQTDLAAPGGDSSDGSGDSSVTRTILAAAPEKTLRATGRLDASGAPKSDDVVRDCTGGTCSYYQYLEGTSMAAPHATGVAAILISRFGKPGPGGLAMAPAAVEQLLYSTARHEACPTPHAYVYRSLGQNATHTCEGGTSKNGFYGHGVVDAWKAATVGP